MLYSKEESALINFSLRTKVENEKVDLRLLDPISELPFGISIFGKLKTEGDGAEKHFIETEVEFTTAEKSFLLKLIERPWGLEDGLVYESVKNKIQ